MFRNFRNAYTLVSLLQIFGNFIFVIFDSFLNANQPISWHHFDIYSYEDCIIELSFKH